MPRLPRVVIPGIPHHVTQRGNRGDAVFDDDVDRRRYLELLQEYGERHGLKLVAYCLMPNHVHLVAIPLKKTSLSAALKPVHLRHAQQLNRSRGEGGLVWQGRFYSCPMDDEHTWTAIRYVERNPVRAKMVRHAEDYPWSSAPAHCGLLADPLLTELDPRPAEESEWATWLEGADDAQVLERLRSRTRTGRPVGSEAFVEKLEGIVGRVLRARKVGRPRKRK